MVEGPRNVQNKLRGVRLLMLTNRVGTEVLRSSHQLPSLEKELKSRRNRLDSIREAHWHQGGPGAVKLAALGARRAATSTRYLCCFLPN